MEDILKQSFADILTSTVDTVRDGVNFLSMEIPEVASQLLMWKMINSLLTSIIPLAMLAVGVGVTVYTVKLYEKSPLKKLEKEVGRLRKLRASTDYMDPNYDKIRDQLHEVNQEMGYAEIEAGKHVFAVVCSSIVTGLLALVSMCTVNLKWLQILIAPKVYLIEYTANLLK